MTPTQHAKYIGIPVVAFLTVILPALLLIRW